MSISALPFTIEIPISLGYNRLSCLISQNIHAVGKECFSIPHNHGCYELRYIAAGSGDQIIEEKQIFTAAGDVLMLHPMEYHYQTEEAISHDLEQYSFCFLVKPPLKSATSLQRNSYHELNKIFQSIRLLKDSSLALLPSFQKITVEILEKQRGYFNSLQSACLALMIDLLRLSGQNTSALFPPEDMKYAFHWREQINRFLRFHYMDDVKLQDLAQAINVSERQASRLIIREFGVNYSYKLTEARIQQAKFLLRYSDMELQAVSSACGFQNYSYFTTCFKQMVGSTPTEYRQAKQQPPDPNA